jgi:hypothetical protein
MYTRVPVDRYSMREESHGKKEDIIVLHYVTKDKCLKDSINTQYIVALCTTFIVHGRFHMCINNFFLAFTPVSDSPKVDD